MRLKDALGAISRGELFVGRLPEATLADYRVAKGVRFLDAVYGRGKWESRVFKNGLNVEDDAECPGGRLAGSYNHACEVGGMFFLIDTVSHGFYEDKHVSFAALTVAWIRAGRGRLREDFGAQQESIPELCQQAA